jgi:ribonuclease HI
MIPKYVYEKPFTIRFPDRSEWKKGYKPDRNYLVHRWLKKKKGTGAGVCCQGTRRKLSYSLGQHTTVFQAEIYAIKACINENIDGGYRNRNNYILSDSQAAIKALGKCQITSKLVWECHQSLIQLARHNRVQLIWVPGHEGIAGN